MQVNVSEAAGLVLDWLVSKCQGVAVYKFRESPSLFMGDGLDKYKPSTDWAQGGPIIEREKLCVGHKHQADPAYCPINNLATNCWARTTAGGYLSYGPTPLIAAMRCYVVSKLGDVVEVPEELLEKSK